jgi:hypothetical protein
MPLAAKAVIHVLNPASLGESFANRPMNGDKWIDAR